MSDLTEINVNGRDYTIKDNDAARISHTHTASDITGLTTITESTVSGWGFTKNTGTYSKPSGGIPKTDLASAVQASLEKADTALQSYAETDPTVPEWAKTTEKPAYTAAEVGAVPLVLTYGVHYFNADDTLPDPVEGKLIFVKRG